MIGSLLSLELGRLCEGDGVCFVHGEAAVDVRLVVALLIVGGGFQSEGVSSVHVRGQIHPLQVPPGQLLDDPCSVSVAEDVDHGAESVSEMDSAVG